MRACNGSVRRRGVYRFQRAFFSFNWARISAPGRPRKDPPPATVASESSAQSGGKVRSVNYRVRLPCVWPASISTVDARSPAGPSFQPRGAPSSERKGAATGITVSLTRMEAPKDAPQLRESRKALEEDKIDDSSAGIGQDTAKLPVCAGMFSGRSIHTSPHQLG